VNLSRVAAWLSAAALIGAGGLVACRRPPTGAPPNVVLIVLDTLRADRLGVYGNRRGLTPFLDQLAARGTRFANAYAPSSWTCPSIASLFTSRYPSQHRVTTFESALGADEVTLAERLRADGYATVGFTANFRIVESLGYTQGFTDWTAYFDGADGGPKPRGAMLRADSVRWLSARTDPSRPVFLYLQYMEPHMPYEPPEPYLSRFGLPASAAVRAAANEKLVAMRGDDLSDDDVALLESLYDAETAAVDEELRLLFAELERLGVLSNAVVLITADHGEEFREHGFLAHGLTLFEPAIRVPLVLLAPGMRGGTVVEEAVSLIDLAPTVLDLVGAASEPRFVGRSLVPLLAPDSVVARLRASVARFAGSPPPPDLLSELYPSAAFDLRAHQAAYLRVPQKLLLPTVGAPEQYDLAADPGERHPRTVYAGESGSELYTALQRRRDALTRDAAPVGTPVQLDDATREKLRALGYQP